MKIKVYESVTEIDEKEWNAIVGRNRLICSHKYLKAIEKSQINDCRYYYPVVYDGNEIIAHTCVYSIDTELDTFARGITKIIINLIRRVWKEFLILRSLECGTPVAIGNTISFKEGADKANVLKLLAQEVEHLAKELNIKTILFRDFYDQELGLFDDLIQLGYIRIHNLPSTEIKIKWKNFDEYLNSIRSRYKWKIIRRMEKCRGEDISIQVLNNFSEYADELEKLWVNIYNHAAEYRRERLGADFFKNIDKYLGDLSAVILIKKGDALVGFTLLLFDDETLIPMYSGLDYAYNKKYCIYFNLLYEIVKVGIERGMSNIELGITTLVPKKEIGATVSSLNMYMKYFSPCFSKIVPRVFDLMTPQPKSKSKNVFRINRDKKIHKKAYR
ncbi:MAG: GNAT family N-acetyltransferase [Candidatus Omnitrophota bacterium]